MSKRAGVFGWGIVARHALRDREVGARDIRTWDLHATATPGDFAELMTLRSVLANDVLVTARKGTFGHGMSAGSGWELTAQYMGYENRQLFPTALHRSELNDAIRELHQQFVFEEDCPAPSGCAGKLSMGIGGINSCVISIPLEI